MEEEAMTIYKEQETLRIPKGDLEYIHEVYQEITGVTERIPPHKFLILAVQKACQISRPHKINEEMKLDNEKLKADIDIWMESSNNNARIANEVQLKYDAIVKELKDFKENSNISKLPENSMLLVFPHEYYHFLFCCLLIYQREKVATTFEEMFTNIINYHRKQGFFNFTEKDIKYVNLRIEEINKPVDEPAE